ncbi:phage tail tape measure protein [Naumannella sp. ID2617S]|nr:phage tail tape measure protein [Naumannella sp. ID2617S]
MADATDPVWIEVLPSMRNFGSEMAKGAGGAAEKVGTEVGKKFGTAMLAGLAVVAGGASLAGAALYKVGSTFDDMADTIRVGTGATGKDLEGLVQSAKNVGKNVPASFEDIGRTVADLNTRMGLTGPQVEKVASQFLELGRITGSKVDIAKTTAAFNQFGVKGDDVSRSMDRLYTISQATGIGVDDLVQKVTAAGPAAQQLGFSFGQTAGLIGTLDKAGINSNATIAAMQKSLVTLAKDGEKPQEAFKRVVGEIQGFVKNGDQAAALNLAGKVFGTRGAAQFIGAIKSGALNLKTLGAVTGETQDSILGAADDTADFAEQWDLFKNRVLLIVEPLASKLFSAIGSGMQWINDNAVPAIQGFGEGWENFTGAGGRAHRVAVDIFDALRGGAEWLVGIVRPAIDGLVAGWRDYTGVGGDVRNSVDFLMGALRAGMDWITQTAIPAVKGFIEGWRDYSGVGGETRTAIDGVVGAIKAVIGFLWQNRDVIAVVAGIITALLIPGWVKAGVEATISAVKQGAAWVSTQGKAIASSFAQSGAAMRIVGSWILMGLTALKSGAQTVAIWAMLQWDAIKSSAAQVAAHARAGAAWVASRLTALASGAVIVGQWIAMGAQATASAALQVAAGVRTAAIWTAQRLAMLGHLAVMGLVRGATIAWTATQWLLNAALSANPIGIIVLGLMLLVGAIIYAWNNSETFRRVVMAAWEGIKTAASAVVNWFVNTALPFLRFLWDAAVAGFVWLKDMVIGAITFLVTSVVNSFIWWRDTLVAIAVLATLWIYSKYVWLKDMVIGAITALVDFVVGRFTWWRDTLVGLALMAATWIHDRFVWMRDAIGGVIGALVDHVVGRFNWWRDTLVGIAETAKNWIVERFEALKTGASNIFQTMVDGIARIWDGLKAVAGAPVKFVIETVLNNGLIKGWNELIGLLKLDDKLKVAPLDVPKFAQGTNRVPGSRSNGVDSTLAVSSAGVPIAHVDPGEGIIRYASMRRLDRNHPGAFDYINRTGMLPGFFLGGRAPVPGPANRHRSGYGFAQWAGDMPQPMGTPIGAWMDGVVAYVKRLTTSYGQHVMVNHPNGSQSLYAHMSRIMVAAGQAVRAGDILGLVGSTGKSTGPHLHFEVRGGNSAINTSDTGDSGGGGLLSMAVRWVTDKLGAPVRALLDKIPGAGMFVDVAKSLGTRAMDSAVEKIKSLIPSLTGSDADMFGVPSGTLGDRVRQIIAESGARVTSVGGYRPEDGYGEHSTGRAFDLMVPNKGEGDKIADYVLRNFGRLGMQHIIWWQAINSGNGWRGMADRGSPTQNHMDHPHLFFRPNGYWRGTNSARSGLAWTGERGPELIDFSGRERVYDAKESKRIAGGGAVNNYFQPRYEEPGDAKRDFEIFAHEIARAAQ